MDNPPLHALKNGVDGSTGVFTYGATSLFPTSSFLSSNYWVDVVLNPTSLLSVTLNPASVIGGNNSTGTVVLSGPAPTGGASVLLTSDSSAAQIPASVSVAAGATTATFPVTTTSVAALVTANISGTYATTRSSALTISPSGLASLTLNPATLIGGTSSTGTVTLSGAAPAGGAVVSLSSDNTTVAQVPQNVTVSSGATFRDLHRSQHAVALNISVTISGTYGTSSNATLNVNSDRPTRLPGDRQGGIARRYVNQYDGDDASVLDDRAERTVVGIHFGGFRSVRRFDGDGVTGGGLTWALVKRTNTQPGGAEIWRAFAPAVLSNATVTANLSQNVVSSITVVTFTGADPSGTNGSGAIGATGGGSGASGAPTASLVTTRNNSWVFGVGTDWDAAVVRTLGTSQTMVHQFLTNVGSTYWVQRQNSVTPLSGTTVTINDTAPTNDKFDLSIVEVLPAALGPPDFSVAASPGQPDGSAGQQYHVRGQRRRFGRICEHGEFGGHRTAGGSNGDVQSHNDHGIGNFNVDHQYAEYDSGRHVNADDLRRKRQPESRYNRQPRRHRAASAGTVGHR